MATVTWTGNSGRTYTYEVYPVGTSFNDVPANYIFTRRSSDGVHTALYVGQTDNLEERITPAHHKWSCAKLHGITHIHVHQNAAESTRLAEERDLLARMSPVCND